MDNNSHNTNMNNHEQNPNPNSSPMHLGMTGGSNPFTADELQELMGLIPGDQPESNPTPSSTEIDEGSKHQARSERKRSREKQRRTDVNKQFGELTEVLKRIESEEQQWLQQQQQQQQHSASEGSACPAPSMVLPPFSPTNRVDLIARTIAHLERLHHVTRKQVQEIQNLEERLKKASKAGEDMAQKLKDTVFQQQGAGMMVMNGMMGNGMVNPWTPMQMAMGGMANAATPVSIPPQKQQPMMMMVPMMMPGANGQPGTPMMPTAQPFMMMPQAFCPQPTAPAPAQPNPSTPAAPAIAQAPKPSPPTMVQPNQMMMQQQQMMMQSMQPMMMQSMMQPQLATTTRQQPMVFSAPPMMATAPVPQPQQQPQLPPMQPAQARLSPTPAPVAAATQSPEGQPAPQQQTQPPAQQQQQQQQQGAGGGSYAYAA